MAASLIVVLTYILFPDLRRQRYIEIMMYVSLNVFWGCLGASLGPVPNYSPACWFQGVTTNANFVIAACWITALTFQLWWAAVYGRVVNSMFWTHVFIWTVPLIFSLLPLTTNTYGNPDGYKANKTTSWCFIVTSTDDADDFPINRYSTTQTQINIEVMWDFLGFYGWVFGTILVNAYFGASILYKLRDSDKSKAQQIKNSVMRLMLYPLIQGACWTYTMVDDIRLALNPSAIKSASGEAAANTIPLLSGIFFSLAFFYINPNARRKWQKLFERTWNRLTGVKVEAQEALRRVSVLFAAATRSSVVPLYYDNPMLNPSELVNTLRPDAEAALTLETGRDSYRAMETETIEMTDSPLQTVLARLSHSHVVTDVIPPTPSALAQQIAAEAAAAMAEAAVAKGDDAKEEEEYEDGLAPLSFEAVARLSRKLEGGLAAAMAAEAAAAVEALGTAAAVKQAVGAAEAAEAAEAAATMNSEGNATIDNSGAPSAPSVH